MSDAMLELPVREPCDLCVALRDERWKIIDECTHTATLINPRQFETGQCCVITHRHVATLLELSRDECEAVMRQAKRVAEALVYAFQPLGILTFQNNGVFSGQETPHFHFHVVPRQPGSDWGVGPPQLAHMDGAGRQRGVSSTLDDDASRHARVHASRSELIATVARLRATLTSTPPGART
jgi:diadenosine tetraphosphate (Ap4A) HIT family hydrolase